ncbi:MAG: NAD(P)H-hydrate dehydratase [Planctomycetia bacterium]|nr:NAD(P)H-hydrate dehydratase [Planctomycetia bacterium]
MKPPADLPRLAPRARNSQKHDFGRVVVIGGARGMAGAPALAALAALRCGAGLVEVLVPDTVATITAGFDPCLMVRGMPAGADGCFAPASCPSIMERVAGATVVAVGPGLGRGEGIRPLVTRLWADAAVPTVFDADALWALAPAPPATTAGPGPRLLTPHEGEMRRFTGGGPAADRAALEDAAAALAAACDGVVLLKGPDTLVADGADRWHNTTGNPGMATGGSGDVLSGMIAGLACQPCLPPGAVGPRRPTAVEVARMAAWAHGRAGDIAAAAVGEVSVTATDLLAAVPRALAEMTAVHDR